MKEVKSTAFFDRDPSMRSLKNSVPKKVNSVFLRDGQLRNNDSYDLIPIGYKSIESSMSSESGDSLQDYSYDFFKPR